MRLSRTRGMKINMGHYESLEFSATVTVDHYNLGLTDEQQLKVDPRDLHADLHQLAEELLLEELREEVAAAIELTDEDKSFVLAHYRIDPPKAKSRKRT